MMSESDTPQERAQREYAQVEEPKLTHSSDSNPLPIGEEPSRLFMGFSRWIISHQKLTVCFTLALTALAMWLAIHQLKINNSMEMFTPPDAPVLKTRNQYRALFGRDDLFLISVRGDVFSAHYLERLKELEAESVIA